MRISTNGELSQIPLVPKNTRKGANLHDRDYIGRVSPPKEDRELPRLPKMSGSVGTCWYERYHSKRGPK